VPTASIKPQAKRGNFSATPSCATATPTRSDRKQVWTDLDELDRLRVEAEAATAEHQQTLLEGALALFRGQPLAGMDALWADSEMRRLCALQVELLERTGRIRLEAGETIGALEAAERAHVLDPSNERPVQLAMEAEAALGRRESVVERYERLCCDLGEQFGLEPSRETKLLYRSLLSQERQSKLVASKCGVDEAVPVA